MENYNLNYVTNSPTTILNGCFQWFKNLRVWVGHKLTQDKTEQNLLLFFHLPISNTCTEHVGLVVGVTVVAKRLQFFIFSE